MNWQQRREGLLIVFSGIIGGGTAKAMDVVLTRNTVLNWVLFILFLFIILAGAIKFIKFIDGKK